MTGRAARAGSTRAGPRRAGAVRGGGTRTGPESGRARTLLTAVPGMAPLVARELATAADTAVTDRGNDGRADVLLCETRTGRLASLLAVRTAEDAFVEVGRTLRRDGDRPDWIAHRLWRPNRVQRALAAWSQLAGERRGTAGSARPGRLTFRVIARVLQERSFRRTELRRALADAVAASRPGWRTGDPAQLEIWVSEYAPGRIVAGLRLSTAAMRQHQGRPVERAGALRPTVAAAMVALAGPLSKTLLDACCGAGTVLAEAATAGWPQVVGRDVDSAAVAAARRNVAAAAGAAGEVRVDVGDARRLDLDDGVVDACVSNLPFGHTFEVPGDPGRWLAAVLAELCRVTRPGGPVVLLVPRLPRDAVPPGLRLAERHPIRLLGRATVLWRLERTAGRPAERSAGGRRGAAIRHRG